MSRAKPRERIGPWKTAFRGRTYTLKVARAAQPSGKVRTKELAFHKPSVIILAIDARGRLMLNYEYRSRQASYVWRLPAGGIETSEAPRAAAQRELREETGFRAKRLTLLHGNDGRGSQSLNWPWYAFAASGLTADPLQMEENEDIEVRRVPLKRAANMALDGTIRNEQHAFLILKLQHQLATRRRRAA